MATPQTETSPDFVTELLLARMKTEVVFAAVKLKVLDTVNDLEPHANVKAVSSQTKIPDCTLQRLLNACVAVGILEVKKNTEGTDIYNTPAKVNKWLLSKSKDSMADLVLFDYHIASNWRRTAELVPEGDDRMKNAATTFEKAETDTNLAKLFHYGMAGYAQPAKVLVKAFDLSNYKTAVDVGGGVGIIAEELKKSYPTMTVSVLELPVTISMAESFWGEKGGQPDFHFVQGDMFDENLPEAELYILSHLLVDWDDDSCRKIFTNVAKAVKPGGAILILDKVLPEVPASDNSAAHLFDMYMLGAPVLAKERTLQQHKDFLIPVGFGKVKFWEAKGINVYDAMLATRQ